MKIEESFRDMKDMLNIDKIMNQKQENMEKMLSEDAIRRCYQWFYYHIP